MSKDSEMHYMYEEITGDCFLVLEPEDWSEEEWNVILKIFHMERADRIVISNYKFEAFGIKAVQITEDEWKQAIAYLNMLIAEYASIGFSGQFGLNGVLIPLKKRYDKGERTRQLYNEIMQCE